MAVVRVPADRVGLLLVDLLLPVDLLLVLLRRVRAVQVEEWVE